jgi:hypothetical protein
MVDGMLARDDVPATGGGDRLLVPPGGDPAMIPREQDLGNLETAELPRPRVLRTFHEPFGTGEGILSGALLVAEHARHEPRDGVHDHHRGHLAAGQHVVADRDLLGPERLADPGVEALVAPADEHEPLAAGEFLDEPLIEPSAAGISWMTPEARSLRFSRNHCRFAENSLKGSIHAASSRSTAKRGIRPTSDRTWNRRKLPSG